MNWKQITEWEEAKKAFYQRTYTQNLRDLERKAEQLRTLFRRERWIMKHVQDPTIYTLFTNELFDIRVWLPLKFEDLKDVRRKLVENGFDVEIESAPEDTYRTVSAVKRYVVDDNTGKMKKGTIKFHFKADHKEATCKLISLGQETRVRKEVVTIYDIVCEEGAEE